MSGVSFLEPLFLWGLLFSGVVLLIHLLKRPRSVRLAFSTLRFFSTSAVAANRSRKLRRLLLLIVRLLIVLLLVIIFARPYNRLDRLAPVADVSAELFIWIDQSPSMTYSDSGASLLAMSVGIVDSLVQLRGGSAGISVYDAEDDAFFSYEQFKQAPLQVRYSEEYTSFGAAIGSELTDATRPVVMLVSDFQKATTDALRSLPLLRKKKNYTIAAVPLTPRHPWNLAVRQARASAEKNAGVMVDVAAYGKSGGNGKLQVTTETTRSPLVACSLSAGSAATVTVPLRTTGQQQWGTVSLQCDDPLSFDNTGYVTFNRQGGYSVLIIGEVTANYPIAAALRAADTAYWAKVARRPARQVTFEECAAADLIIVNNCSDPIPPLTVLRDTRGAGQQAFIITGGNDARYRIPWEAFGKVFAPKGEPRQVSEPLSVKLNDTASGLGREFPALFSREVHVYTYTSGLSGMALLNLTDGQPLATGNEDASGRRWVLCATPLGITESNNLCETGFYVPFIDRLARYACARLAQRDEQWIAGKAVQNPWYGGSSPAQIFSATDGRLLMRLQQQQRFTVALPGVYKVVPPGASPYFKTVVPDTLESRCDYRIPDRATPGCEHWEVVPPAALFNYLRHHRRTVWQVIPWIILVMLLAAEVLLRERRAGKES